MSPTRLRWSSRSALRRWPARGFGLAVALVGALALASGLPARAAAPSDARILLNQKRMEIGQLIALVSKETGRTILHDDSVRGIVSLVSKRPVTEEEAWQLLDAALHLLGFAIVPSTVDQWRITRVAEAVGESPFVARPRPGSERFVTALIPLEEAGLQSVMNVVQPLAGATTTIVALEDSNSLIASGPEGAIARLTAIADELDRVEERKLRQRVLRYRSVLDVEQMIQFQLESGRFADRDVEVWSDERTNSLIFRGTQETVEALVAFLEGIDQPIEGEGEIRVLRVINRDAGDVAQILGGQVPSRRGSSETGGAGSGSRKEREQSAGDDDARSDDRSRSRDEQSSRGDDEDANAIGPNAAPDDAFAVAPPEVQASSAGSPTALDLKSLLGGEDYSIAVDGPTRSLVVRASERGHRIIRELVEELDARPQLIAVDVTVSELRTPSAWALSLSYHVPLLPGDALDELVGRLISLPAGGGFGSGPIADGALFGRVSRDAGIDFEIPGEGGVTIPVEDTGQIDATDIKGRIEVLLQPSLVLVAGEEHEIFVGNNVPIPVANAPDLTNVDPTNPASGALGITVQFNREDIGLRLGLEARAGEVGPIELDLDTEITAIGPSAAGAIERVGPTLIKEELTAKARLADGETAIVGINRQRKEQVSQGGTPWLSDIPLLGWLFKARGKQVDDVRLVIAARARRISTPAELVADTIRRRLAFDRRHAREEHLPELGSDEAPFGVLVTTRAREDDADAIARDLERRGHRTRVHRWQSIDRRTLYDVYVLGLDSLSDAGELAYRLGEDGWDADLVVFRSRS